MKLHIATSFTVMMLCTSTSFAETINLRNSCDTWEHIPANEALKSPVAALLQCTDNNGSWLALQIMCFPQTAEIEFRYRPSYPIVSPIPVPEIPPIKTQEVLESYPELPQKNIIPTYTPLGEKEMIFFDFPDVGITRTLDYNFDVRDWNYKEKLPTSALFANLISGNFADISMLALGTTERLPLRGSTKALSPVVESCRLAKIHLKQLTKQAAQD
jgi:hypothetical protein